MTPASRKWTMVALLSASPLGRYPALRKPVLGELRWLTLRCLRGHRVTMYVTYLAAEAGAFGSDFYTAGGGGLRTSKWLGDRRDYYRRLLSRHRRAPSLVRL